MNVIPQSIPDVLLIEPKVFGDPRGFFLEIWNGRRYGPEGVPGPFVQDNVSLSRRGTLRGLHFQSPNAQGKLVHVLHGEVFDVAVDLRPDSPTFGGHVSAHLSAENHRQLWIPPGFAHGFVVLSETALFAYKCTAYYAPQHEHSLRWDDPDLEIDWPVLHPILSPKDATAPHLRDLPRGSLSVATAPCSSLALS